MSEYWKSTPKYWCKHCSTYVKDTPFERRQHEGTTKHQNNLKRFLRDIQNSHERGEREKERAKSEVERLKGVAGGDTGRSASPSQSSSKQSRPFAQNPLSNADRKRQWAQLADMGIKVPEEFRSEMAMVGDWQVVSQQVVDESPSETPLSIGVKKRKYEGQEEDEEEKQEAGEAVVRRGWGATTKRYPGEDKADLDELLSGSISLKRETPGSLSTQFKSEEKDSLQPGHKPVLSQHGHQSGDYTSPKVESFSNTRPDEDGLVVKGEPGSTQPSKSMDRIPEEIPIPVFKRRKAKIS
ncbi:uncharacterized protein Z519_03808 [Cladophialophora bantiana CBS 173.52]|uniref:Matrin-type domain-containing protein n=1 Tax=Cladophialophora bantiana (strain ATCC 10958 / CBS 173.52 / CDC B-1940 / NIH 8579) TaxID=1442370 RepID=A0A0D2IEK8_CLAB1|nr:uncharacterized protein Z519_03808 [Cladophialophora bantiana CBS 173.52]KIW95224.1 hypothetical protein Z519_03808 [Cladophialophora bantiana CBS 173.52]